LPWLNNEILLLYLRTNTKIGLLQMQLSKLLYKNIFWRGLNMASVFVLNVLIAQVFGAANYGCLFYYINTLAFIVLLVGFSLDSSFTFYNAKPATNTTQF